MVGVKDHGRESLVGQAGEVGPVYDKYAVSFFVFEPDGRRRHLPQLLGDGPAPEPSRRRPTCLRLVPPRRGQVRDRGRGGGAGQRPGRAAPGRPVAGGRRLRLITTVPGAAAT
jgi:hypothetical protein